MNFDYSNYAWIVPIFPLLAFLVLMILGRQMKRLGTIIAISSIAASFAISVLLFVSRVVNEYPSLVWEKLNWLKIGDSYIKLGFEVNNLNVAMLVIVTLVSLLVNIYSISYMEKDERYNVFFSYIALFSFSMLSLVISSNMIQFYIFWELVGVSSFLLVGFWFYKPAAKAAAKKAFIITRIGDLGLFIAILLLYWYMPNHALDFSSINAAVQSSSISPEILTWIAVLIFIAAIGKSGQFPLHTWLPDAMEGPTPISALIHAATMVAAGVFLVAITYDIFQASTHALLVVSIIGGFTALFAASIAIVQNDIKRILAYSTISQLGYMMLALGIGDMITNGMFHLFTHAFFKALLFLTAGSVIHSVHTQNVHEMGGLSKTMKITTTTFAIGALALIGIPPFAGFWSKDAILTTAYLHHPVLFWIGIATAFLTALYMTRLFTLVFMGKSKNNLDSHESPKVMTIPLIILAVFSMVAGFMQTPFHPWLAQFLTSEYHEEVANWTVIFISTFVGLLGIVLGYLIYQKNMISTTALSIRFKVAHRLLLNKYYIDEIYEWIITKPLQAFGKFLVLFDRYVISGFVSLTTTSVILLGKLGSRIQNGQLQNYGLITLLGILLLALAIIGRRFMNVG
jgi:NADH-quinone oxidoreductase subunit L